MNDRQRLYMYVPPHAADRDPASQGGRTLDDLAAASLYLKVHLLVLLDLLNTNADVGGCRF
jgi:hypothetical protein